MYYLLKIPGVASISRVSKILNWNAPVLHMYGNLSAHKTRHKAETETPRDYSAKGHQVLLPWSQHLIFQPVKSVQIPRNQGVKH